MINHKNDFICHVANENHKLVSDYLFVKNVAYGAFGRVLDTKMKNGSEYIKVSPSYDTRLQT